MRRQRKIICAKTQGKSAGLKLSYSVGKVLSQTIQYWVFNAAPVLKERAAWMALNEGLTYAWDAEKRARYAQKSMMFIDRITDTLSKKMVRKVKDRYGVEVWPWDRDGFHKTHPR